MHYNTYADIPPVVIKFEKSVYNISEEHGELEVCVLADELSVPVQVLVETVNLTAEGKYTYARMVALKG